MTKKFIGNIRQQIGNIRQQFGDISQKIKFVALFVGVITVAMIKPPSAFAAGRRTGRVVPFLPSIPENSMELPPRPNRGYTVRAEREAGQPVRPLRPLRPLPVESPPEVPNHELLSTLANMTLDSIPSTEDEERLFVVNTQQIEQERRPVVEQERRPVVEQERRPVGNIEQIKEEGDLIVKREANGSVTRNYRFVREMQISDNIDQNPRANQLLTIGNQPLEPKDISLSKIWEDFQPNKVDVTKAANRYRFTRRFIHKKVVVKTMELLGEIKRSPEFDEPTKVWLNPKIKSWENDIMKQTKTFRSAAKISLDYEITRKETKPWKSHLTKTSDSIKHKKLEKTLKREYQNTENLLENVTNQLFNDIAATPFFDKLMARDK